MLKISAIIGKRVVSLQSAEIEGVVLDVVFDERLSKTKMLKVLNEEGDEMSERFVQLRFVKNLDADALAVMNPSSLKPFWQIDALGAKNPINSECFNQDGIFLGRVRDVQLGDGGAVAMIEIEKDGEKKELKPNMILNRSEGVLIINDTGKKMVIKKTPSQKGVAIPSGIVEQKVAISDEGKISVPQRVIVEKEPEPEFQPNHFKYLLDKLLKKDIVDSNGKVILFEGTKVGFDEISIAKKGGKLVHLALNVE
ncbi:MAG: hypothetical protein FWC11_00665 [Firmicutes bacterium]|nr:hypothetical protein [Bacillota bacterium]